MKDLIKQIQEIQDILLEYNIKNASIFGSRVYGTNNEFSDLDIAIDASEMFKLFECNKTVQGAVNLIHTTIQGFVRQILDYIIEEAKDRIKVDISPLYFFTKKELLNAQQDLLENSVDILFDGNQLSPNKLETKIQEIRAREIVFERDEFDISYYIISAFTLLSTITRYYKYLNSKVVILEPSAEEYLYMRNDTISTISKFSIEVDKFSEHEMVKNIIPLKDISALVKREMKQSQNYNTSDLGWEICSPNKLTSSEMDLYWEFFITIKNFLFNLISDKEMDCVDGVVLSRMNYEHSVEDIDGFLEAMKRNYREKIGLDSRKDSYKMLLLQVRAL